MARRVEARVVVETIASTLFTEIWVTRGYDARLRDVLNVCMGVMRVGGIVARVREREAALGCVAPSIGEEAEVLRQVTHVVDGLLGVGAGVRRVERFELAKGIAGVVVAVRRDGGAAEADAEVEDDSQVEYCAMLYKRKGGADDLRAERIAPATLPMLLDVFRQRERRFMTVSAKLSEQYWRSSRTPERRREGTERRLVPPWERSGAVRTATLCLDLRKSTFCMEHADEGGEFAEWLDQLVQILGIVCHKHGGVFDKFTGDGALVHFPDDESRAVYERAATDAAVICAVDMQRALDVHVERLRGMLRFNSRLLGAGVAIDVADAHWSLDHRDNPITVGKGVVSACRLCDGAAAGTIRMTNIAYRQLLGDIREKLPAAEEVELESKEMRKEMEVTVWQVRLPRSPQELDLGTSRDLIGEMCRRIYRQGKRGIA